MKEDKWNKLNKELDNALDAEFGSEKFKHPKVFSENGNQLFFDEEGKLIKESKQESVFENARLVLREHLFDNKAKVARDLEQMREWSNTNKQETLEEVAEEFSKNHSIYPTAQDDTEYGFKHGAKWQQERMFKIMDTYAEDVMGGSILRAKEWFEQFKKK